MDDIKVAIASILGVGNWALQIDLILQIAISVATLIYIILKIRSLTQSK